MIHLSIILNTPDHQPVNHPPHDDVTRTWLPSNKIQVEKLKNLDEEMEGMGREGGEGVILPPEILIPSTVENSNLVEITLDKQTVISSLSVDHGGGSRQVKQTPGFLTNWYLILYSTVRAFWL